MQLNTDFSLKVVIHTDAEPWTPSSLSGLDRRTLERRGRGNASRATTLVRYRPGSSFSPHTHDGGHEFLVIEGAFSDEHGHYGKGTYVRNPVGFSHTPRSEEGCTLFAKRNQMDVADRRRVHINTSAATWFPGPVAGLEVIPLHQFGSESCALVRWAPGSVFQPHRHVNGEEILVLEGVFEDEHGVYPQGTWLRSPAGSVHYPHSTAGCTIFVKTGHLGPNATIASAARQNSPRNGQEFPLG